MLLEADNVHRPKIDMQHLQDDYGQDIVDFILASTNTRRYTPEDALAEVMVFHCFHLVIVGSDIFLQDERLTPWLLNL